MEVVGGVELLSHVDGVDQRAAEHGHVHGVECLLGLRLDRLHLHHLRFLLAAAAGGDNKTCTGEAHKPRKHYPFHCYIENRRKVNPFPPNAKMQHIYSYGAE